MCQRESEETLSVVVVVVVVMVMAGPEKPAARLTGPGGSSAINNIQSTGTGAVLLSRISNQWRLVTGSETDVNLMAE